MRIRGSDIYISPLGVLSETERNSQLSDGVFPKSPSPLLSLLFLGILARIPMHTVIVLLDHSAALRPVAYRLALLAALRRISGSRAADAGPAVARSSGRQPI
jgi:hypothetical protein